MQVVVTGIGVVSALGASRSSTWETLLAGGSGIRRHSLFPGYSNIPFGILGESPQSLENLIQTSVEEAMTDANLETIPPKTGVVLGSSRGNQAQIEAAARGELSLQLWPMLYQSSPSAIAARLFQIQGPLLAPRAACATGLWAIAQGADLIRQGVAEVVIAGGVEAPITPLTVAGFQKMGALTCDRAAPFDQNRSGFVLGEGAAVFVLESSDRARRRNQSFYGAVLGFGSSADGYHMTAPNPDPKVAIHAVGQCLCQSRLSGKEIDFVHTHGTGTRLNDINEANIIRHLCPQAPPCTSSKGSLGHTLGASGALGSAICLLGIKHGVVPPCTGLNHLDPACDIRVVQTAESFKLRTALCLSFGFGGQNAAIAFGRASE